MMSGLVEGRPNEGKSRFIARKKSRQQGGENGKIRGTELFMAKQMDFWTSGVL